MTNIQEIYKNIYRIDVPLTGNPLKVLDSYYIKGDNRELLIDTGFRTQECRDVLEEGLKYIGSNPDKRDVYVTHMHSDHSGMCDWFVGPSRNIFMSAIDLDHMRQARDKNFNSRNGRFNREGFTTEMMDKLSKTSPSSIYLPDDWNLPQFFSAKDGFHINVGEYDLEVISVPGHTPGNTMLWDENHQIMFTSDHVLYDITPNITSWGTMKDALGSYLESLDKAYAYPVKYGFPAHREIGNYHERIQEIKHHHEKRIAEALKVVTEYPGCGANDIAGHMSWKIHAKSNKWEDFPLVQKFFAVGECMSHLDYLMRRDKIHQVVNEDGTHHYFVNEL